MDFIPDEQYNPDIKRRISKAQNLDYKLQQGDADELINIYYDLQLKSYQKQKALFPLSRTQFESYVRNMRTDNNICIYLIYYQSKPVNGITVLYGKDTAYYFLAGSDPEYLSTGLNQVLFVYVVNEVKKRKISKYDLRGANTPSIAFYKATYNFPLIPYYRVFKIFGQKAKILLKLKALYERCKI
jgi:lipid II:glycine glycyltransferase (peptidoglycan interpeptide bridge formation enzyme)